MCRSAGLASRSVPIAFASLVVVAFAGASVQAGFWGPSEPKIIDTDLQADAKDAIREVARVVCETSKLSDQRIARISTIDKLIDYLGGLDSSDSLYGCARTQLNCLKEFQTLLATSNENVCSEEKVSLIGEFHHRYVSTTEEDVKARKDSQANDEVESIEPALQLIKTLFMHYAMEVSAACKRTLINSIEWDLADKFKDIKEDFRAGSGTMVDNLIGGLSKYLGSANSVGDYDDVVLIWDIVAGSMYDAKNQLTMIRDEMNDPASGEPVKLIAKMPQTESVLEMQEKCRARFRPVYAQVILPIIRLADLGYSNSGKGLDGGLRELRSNENIARWFGITQVCEAILPIMVVQDETLPAGQSVLIGREEALDLLEKYPQPERKAVEKFEYQPTTNVFVGYDLVVGVMKVETRNLVESVKTGVAARDRAVQRALSKLFKGAKEFIKRKTFKLFVSSDDDNKDQSTPQRPDKDDKKDAHKLVDIGAALESPLDKFTDRDLLKIEGSRPRRVQSTEGFRRTKNRQRPGSGFSPASAATAQMLSYKHSKTWAQMFQELENGLYGLLPGRRTMLVIAMVIIGTLTFALLVMIIAGCG